MYILMDLERTIGSGLVHYWKGNRHGYTAKVEEAGIFSQEVAQELVQNDRDSHTIAIEYSTVENILKP